MDRHYSRANMYKLDCDWRHDTWHINHKYQDMDRHIVDLCTLDRTDTEHRSYILDGNRVVHPNSQAGMNKLDDFVFHDNHYTSHMVMDDTDYPLAVANMLLQGQQ